MAKQQANELIRKIFGQSGEGTSGYTDIINQGYRNLGQPYQDSPRMEGGQMVGDRVGKTAELATNLAVTYADRFLKATGNLPSEDQIRQFLAQNVTVGNAQKFITGNLNSDQADSLADYHIQANPVETPGVQTPQQQIQSLPGQVSNSYDQERKSLSDAINAAYVEPRRAAIADEAALGRLRSPASIPAIGAVDNARAQSLSQSLSGSYGRQTGDILNTGRFAAELGQRGRESDRNFGLANRQFMAGEDQRSYEQGQRREEMSLAERLGKKQADANKPGWMDYANLALGGTSAIASSGKNFGWWGGK